MTRRQWLTRIVTTLAAIAVAPKLPVTKGISARWIMHAADAAPCRIDVLYGWAVMRPELVCRLMDDDHG